MTGIAAAETGTVPFRIDYSFMSTRRDKIDEELRHLRMLASQFTDQQTLDGIKALTTSLEAERAALHPDKS